MLGVARGVLVSLFAVSVLTSGAAWAKPLHFMVEGGADDHVTFNSNAPVEVINGKTNKVTGKIKMDDSFKFDAKHPFDIQFTVDLNSLDTGIDLRDQHMRDNYLETSKYPKTTFKATSIKLAKKPDLKKSQVVDLVATGDFSLHGVTVKKTIPLKVAYTPAAAKKPAAVRIQGKFPIPLQQHGIKRPEAAAMKIADTIYVDLDMSGTAH